MLILTYPQHSGERYRINDPLVFIDGREVCFNACLMPKFRLLSISFELIDEFGSNFVSALIMTKSR